MFKNVGFIASVFLCSALLYSAPAENSASVANRRTAIRYLQLSKQYASEKSWDAADSNAKLGLAYDDKIADLWYLRAVSQRNSGGKKSAILPLVEKAMTEGEWVDYNRDSARILYADLLCSVRKFDQAFSVLDSSPFIYSADAEYIRARSYYSLGGADNYSKARSKIDAARRVYPTDVRFAQLFYKYEYMIFRQSKAKTASGTVVLDEKAQKLSDAFIAGMPVYKNVDPDTEVLAALFCSDSNKRVRMLKSFAAKNHRSPLFAVIALENGLLKEQAAMDYLYGIADQMIPFSIIEDFIPLLKDSENKREFGEYLNAYNGVLLFDTDSDLIDNMSVVYNRGRPQKIFYDENQDDEEEWVAECDFGVPVVLNLAENAMDIFYTDWPFISKVEYKMEGPSSDDSDGSQSRALTFNLIAETLRWTPFRVNSDSSVKENLGVDFFKPVLSDEKEIISGEELLKAALNYEMPSKERENSVIKVSLLNGEAQIATYSESDKVYAVAQFENGIPVLRTVDADGDGMFETTEMYGFSRSMSQNYISVNDEMQIMTNLFGSPAHGTGFYVKKIQIDRNGDTVPDFIEEYTEGKGKISSWDLDSDGNWDVRYVRLPETSDRKIIEEASFHQPLSNSLVTVVSENGIPVSVKAGNQILEVKKGNTQNFYWIEDETHRYGTSSDEEKIREKINLIADQGVSTIVENENERFLAVRIEKMIFAERMPRHIN